MAYLLDTHTFLRFVAGSNKLPVTIANKIKDIDQPCFISVASLWEITIKHQLGKLTLNISLEELFNYPQRNQIEIIQITPDHLLTLSKLPNHHSDPFDRLIISQTISEDMTLLTIDKTLKKYKIKQQWA